MSKTHTPGPWQVVTDEHPHHLGGKHIQRRIFTEWDHPQLKGPLGVVNVHLCVGAKQGDPAVRFVNINDGDASLISAAPELLALLKQMHQYAAGFMLSGTATEEFCEWAKNARAAIAKAEGGAQ